MCRHSYSMSGRNRENYLTSVDFPFRLQVSASYPMTFCGVCPIVGSSISGSISGLQPDRGGNNAFVHGILPVDVRIHSIIFDGDSNSNGILWITVAQFCESTLDIHSHILILICSIVCVLYSCELRKGSQSWIKRPFP